MSAGQPKPFIMPGPVMRQTSVPWFFFVKSLGLAVAAALLLTIVYAAAVVVSYWGYVGV